MENIGIIRIILLTAYAFIAINDAIHADFGLNRPLIAGFVAGAIMGDINYGLAVGATLQLMVLGVSNFGGASMPDFMSAALIGTSLGIISGQGYEFGIGLAIPVGMLLVQLDVFARFTNTYLQHRAESAIDDLDIKKIEQSNVIGVFTWGLSRAIPVCLCLILGSTLVETFVSYFPQQLSDGLRVAGGMLPSVGIAILLRYLPTRKYIAYLFIGFLLASYMNVPMLGVAIAGLASGLIIFNKSGKEDNSNIGGMNDDE